MNAQVKKVNPEGDKQIHRLYVACEKESVTKARVQAAEKGVPLAVVLGDALDEAFATEERRQ
jgi:hypothetical protein